MLARIVWNLNGIIVIIVPLMVRCLTCDQKMLVSKRTILPKAFSFYFTQAKWKKDANTARYQIFYNSFTKRVGYVLP